MKRTGYFNVRSLILLIMVMLLLVACRRSLQPDLEDASPPAAPQIDPIPQQPVDPPLTAPETVPEQPEDPPTAPVEGEQPTETQPSDQPPGEEPPSTAPAEPPPPTAQPSAPGEPVTYVVQAGDTLGRIAQRFNVSVEDIARANQIVNVNVLSAGQILTIPVGGLPDQPSTGETVHVVQVGDNLYRIGLRYGFTVSELTAYNNLANSHWIYVGQQIRIPPRN